jgi:hypothetical protein
MTRPVSPRVTALPAEIETIRTMIAGGETGDQIGAVLGRTKSSVMHIVQRNNLGPWLSRKGCAPRDTSVIPDDFVQMWQTMMQRDLALHYKRSALTISIWTKGKGLVRIYDIAKARSAKRPPEQRKKPRLVITAAAGHKPARVEIYRDQSPAGLAVTYLRKLSPVYRCNENGRHDEAGKFWLRGHTVLTDADVIERADWLRSRERRVA